MEGLCPRPCLPALGLWTVVARPGGWWLPTLGQGSGEHGLLTVRLCHLGLPGSKGPTFLYSLSAQNRGRLADKRTVALPPARVLKKELTPSFIASDGDSDGSGPACGQRSGLKQEDDTHVRIMKRRYFPRARARRGHVISGARWDFKTGLQAAGGRSRPEGESFALGTGPKFSLLCLS